MLAIIPARGGSKGILNKNIISFCGKPLLFWTIERALESKLITNIIVSSDSEEILLLVKTSYSSVTLHQRSIELSADSSKTIDLLQSLSNEFTGYKNIVLLQPTSPLRPSGFVDKVIDKHLNAVKSLTLSGFWSASYPFGAYNNMPRQSLKENFYDDGSVYVFNSSCIQNGVWIPEDWEPFINDFPFTIEIDTRDELNVLETIFKKYYK
jgi:CMP-N,N'-diacetyllegionaminic acid synthase